MGLKIFKLYYELEMIKLLKLCENHKMHVKIRQKDKKIIAKIGVCLRKSTKIRKYM